MSLKPMSAYTQDLLKQKSALVESLNACGVESSPDEKLNTLVPKVAQAYKSGQLSVMSSSEHLRGVISGTSVTIKDVSPFQHNIDVKLSGDINTDTKVIRSGKNLFRQSIIKKTTVNGMTYEYLPDEDCVLFNGTKTTANALTVKLPIPIEGELDANYTITTKYVSGSVTRPSGGYAVVYFGGGDTTTQSENWQDCGMYEYDNRKVAKMTKKYINYFWFYTTKGIVFDNYKVKIQLEKGSAKANYEKYVEPVEVIPSENGTLTVPSAYPTTILTTDTEGVTIDAEYFKDIDKAFEEIQAQFVEAGIMTLPLELEDGEFSGGDV